MRGLSLDEANTIIVATFAAAGASMLRFEICCGTLGSRVGGNGSNRNGSSRAAKPGP